MSSLLKIENLCVSVDEKLILNQWLLSLFEVADFQKLAEPLKSLDLEWLDADRR